MAVFKEAHATIHNREWAEKFIAGLDLTSREAIIEALARARNQTIQDTLIQVRKKNERNAERVDKAFEESSSAMDEIGGMMDKVFAPFKNIFGGGK